MKMEKEISVVFLIDKFWKKQISLILNLLKVKPKIYNSKAGKIYLFNDKNREIKLLLVSNQIIKMLFSLRFSSAIERNIKVREISNELRLLNYTLINSLNGGKRSKYKKGDKIVILFQTIERPTEISVIVYSEKDDLGKEDIPTDYKDLFTYFEMRESKL